MIRATNAKSKQVAINGSAGAYVEVVPFDSTRQTLLINVTGSEALNLTVGHEVPADASAFPMAVGSQIDFYTAPNGPVFARSATTTATSVAVVAD